MELVGFYKNDTNENLDEYFRSMGMPYLARKLLRRCRPTVAILKIEDFWTITMKATLTTRERSFQLGQEYTEYLPGRVVHSVTTMENGNLVTRSTIDHKWNTTTIYEIADEKLIITLLHDSAGVEAKRHFIKVKTQL